MTDGFIVFTETDYGSKARTKQAVEALPSEISKEARWRLRNWWDKVKETAKALCPVDYGILQATIRIEHQTIVFGGHFEKAVSPEHELIDAQIVAGGMLVHPKTGRIVDYAQAVHDGHFTRGGRFIPPNPFITMAVNLHIDELYQILGESVDKSINTIFIE